MGRTGIGRAWHAAAMRRARGQSAAVRPARGTLAAPRHVLAWFTGLLLLVLAGFAHAAERTPAADPLPPVIVVGLMASFAPYQVWPEGADPGGIDVDLLDALGRTLRRPVAYRRFERFDDARRALERREIDVLSGMARTPAREATLRFTRRYAVLQQALVGRDSETSLPDGPDLGGRRIAVVRGHPSENNALQRFPLAPRTPFDTIEQALDAVAAQRADVLLEALPAVVHAIERDRRGGLAVLRRLTLASGELHLAVLRDQPALADALDQALARLGAPAIEQIEARWHPVTVYLRSTDAAVPMPALPPGTPALRIGYARDDWPYSALEGSEPRGIAIELMQAVARRAGLRIEAFVPLDRQALDAALVDGRIHLALGLAETAARRGTLRFVGPYHSSPVVLVSPLKAPVWELHQASGRPLAVADHELMQAFLAVRHPGIRPLRCNAAAACLALVDNGQASAAVLSLDAMREQHGNAQGLHVSGLVPGFADEHHLTLPAAHAALAPVLRAALDGALQQDLPAIERAWAQQVREAWPLQRLLRWATGAALAFLLLGAAWGWHSRALKRQIALRLDAQQRAEQAQAVAEQAHRESEHYLAFMAHEVRNALQSVAGAVALLRGSARGDARTQSMFNALAHSARATLGLLNSLLDRHRLHAGQLSLSLAAERPLDMADAVVDEMRPAALAKGLTLKHEADPSAAAWVRSDALRVQQVLRNLIVNAIKFSERGSITVATRCWPDDGGRLTVEFAVEDQGPGLDAAQRARLFERFQAGRGDRPGSGLGLALSRDIATLLGGALDCDSTPGIGSRFVLRFFADPARPEASRAGLPKRLLLVEDSPVYGMLLEQAFRQQGVQVAWATTLEEARAMWPREAPDLVVSDVHLPDGTVDDLLRWRALDADPGPPMAVMSAELTGDDVLRYTALGAAEVLVKDADPMAFVARVLRGAAAPPVRTPSDSAANAA